MEMSGWLMAPHHILDVWRFASVRPGALSVTTCGELVMPAWCADNLDSPDSVRQLFWVIIAANRIHIQFLRYMLTYLLTYLQMQQHNLVQHLVQAVAPSLWLMLVVLEMRPGLWTACPAISLAAVHTLVMQVPPVYKIVSFVTELKKLHVPSTLLITLYNNGWLQIVSRLV